MSLRLFAGEVRGRSIEIPPGVRPTEGRVRSALFSIWRDRVPGSRFLDLFAGSGAVGFEAWGLGASRVCFVEQAPRALAVLRRNGLAVAGPAVAGPAVAGPAVVGPAVAPACEVVRGRLPEALARRVADEFDLIFADPPYGYAGYDRLVEAGIRRLTPDGELAVEHSARVRMPEARDCRRYGDSCLSFFRRSFRDRSFKGPAQRG